METNPFSSMISAIENDELFVLANCNDLEKRALR